MRQLVGLKCVEEAGPFLAVKRGTSVGFWYTAPESLARPAVCLASGYLVIGLCVFLGNKFFLADEEEREGGGQKRKRKKKSHLQPEHLGFEVKAVAPEQNGDGEPEAGPGRAQRPGVVVLGTAGTPSSQELSRWEHHPSNPPTQTRRRRHRKRGPRAQGQSTESAGSPLEDVFQGGPSSGHPQVPAKASEDDGAPALKRKRKLGPPLVNGSGPPTLAWPLPGQEDPPMSPADRGDCPATPPLAGRLKKKKGDSSSLDLYNPSTQKTAIFKKRKKMKDMLNLNLVEHSQVLESELKLVQALVRHSGSGVRGGRSDLWTKEQSWLITHFTNK